ncbi:hypothetical protein I6F48_00405 [Pseudoalteromonas sp. SWYJ118]|uniref:hypothetical protein n=1 Tax=Pseudoalteromonas sp. SWYJ118 TaxID=2792062 RepID=UPI0018CDE91F|nr:hypothetical protein [Pseudoalteromonas sp. SWYJ118]MBH0074025.1 hypothetical protein [Pseudoalteromonas sp. SWYJ118]
MKDTIHQINNYKSRYDFRDLFLVLNLKQETLNHLLEELNSINVQIKSSIKLFKKNKNKKNKDICNEHIKHNKQKITELEQILTGTGLIKSLESLTEPELFDDLTDQLGLATTANRLHGNALKMSFHLIQKDKAIIEKLNQELQKININYKQAIYLVKSVIDNNEDDYFQICRIIEKNFLKLPMVLNKTDCEEAIIGCLRGSKYLEGTHPKFNLIHNKIDFPEIYLIKVAISKALH